jgi:NAD(P)-dependent dehydrogenase (short-subunit alcohol dehydrogenase family)
MIEREGRRPVVVVTGASAGIGRAIAREFAQHGWRVALLARGVDGLDGARADVQRLGGEALVLPTDVADEKQVEAAAAQVEATWGDIDVWVNDAMATIFAPALEIAPEDFRRATEVTYLGAVWGTLAALKRMKARNRGTIVQIGSALAYRSIPLQAPYCGAKAAVRGFIDSIRCELAHDRSHVHITMVQLSALHAAVRMGSHDNAPPPAPDGQDLPARAGGPCGVPRRHASAARVVGRLAGSAGHPRYAGHAGTARPPACTHGGGWAAHRRTSAAGSARQPVVAGGGRPWRAWALR